MRASLCVGLLASIALGSCKSTTDNDPCTGKASADPELTCECPEGYEPVLQCIGAAGAKCDCVQLEVEPEPDAGAEGEPVQTLPSCGDGRVVGLEQCDDGNVTAGDGCSPLCQTETPPVVGIGGLTGVRQFLIDDLGMYALHGNTISVLDGYAMVVRQLALGDALVSTFAVDKQGGVAAAGVLKDPATNFDGHFVKYWPAGGDDAAPRSAHLIWPGGPIVAYAMREFRETDLRVAFSPAGDRLGVGVLAEAPTNFTVTGHTALYDLDLTQLLDTSFTHDPYGGGIPTNLERSAFIGLLPSSSTLTAFVRWLLPGSNDRGVGLFDAQRPGTANSAQQINECASYSVANGTPGLMFGAVVQSAARSYVLYSAGGPKRAYLIQRPDDCRGATKGLVIPALPTAVRSARTGSDFVLANSPSGLIEVRAGSTLAVRGLWTIAEPASQCQLTIADDLVCLVDGKLIGQARATSCATVPPVALLPVGSACLFHEECSSSLCAGTCQVTNQPAGAVCTRAEQCASAMCVQNSCG
jgi:cysteine-rich repeat protein